MSILSMLQMIQISDSLFPIGSFTLSNGLETMVVQGTLTTPKELETYLRNYMQLLPYQNLGVMMLAYRHAEDTEYLRELDEMALAVRTPREVREGTIKLCRRFLKLWRDIHPYPRLEWYRQEILEARCQGDHAVAVGLYARVIGLDLDQAEAVYAYQMITAIVTNAVKTVPLSQIAGQRILSEALGQIERCVAETAELTIDDLGVGGTQSDIAAMNHETLYSRLYMS